MDEIICIDDYFEPVILKIYDHFGVTPPKKDSIYNIREVIRVTGLTDGFNYGFLLEELVNPKVPYEHPVLQQIIMVEPNWNYKRFAKLNGESISINDIKETIKQKIQIKKIIEEPCS